MDKDYFIKFQPSLWLNDMELRSCSPRSRALLVDLMCLMHNSREYGFLIENGARPDAGPIAHRLGFGKKSLLRCVDELLGKGVLKEDDRGILFCPRMLKDREKRLRSQEYGRRGGNPQLTKKGVNPTVNPKVNQDIEIEIDKDKESSNQTEKVGKPEALADDFELWYSGYPRKSGEDKALAAYNRSPFTPAEKLLARDVYKKYLEVSGTPDQYVKNAANFLGDMEKFVGVCGTCNVGPRDCPDGSGYAYCKHKMVTVYLLDKPDCPDYQARQP